MPKNIPLSANHPPVELEKINREIKQTLDFMDPDTSPEVRNAIIQLIKQSYRKKIEKYGYQKPVLQECRLTSEEMKLLETDALLHRKQGGKNLIYEEYFLSRPVFHRYEIATKMTKRERDVAELLNTRFEKYHQDIEKLVSSYYRWMDNYLATIDIGKNPELLAFYKQNKNKDRIKGDSKAVFAKRIAEQIELARFYSATLKDSLCNIEELLTSKTKTAEEKSDELERLYYIYDIVRVIAYEFNNNSSGLAEFDIDYLDKKNCRVEVDECYGELYDLSMPDDYRACRMFLDMHRLGHDRIKDKNGLTKAHWGVYFCYQYVTRIFSLGHFSADSMDLKYFPRRLLEKMATPLTSCILYVHDGLQKALKDLLDIGQKLEENQRNKYLLTEHDIILAPITNNIERAGIFPPESKEEEFRNLVFVLGRSLDAVDLLCDHLAYFLNTDDPILGKDKEEIDKYYHKLIHLRGEIVYYTYANVRQYDSAHEGLELKTILLEEKSTLESINKQLYLCDTLREFGLFASVSTLDRLMKKKKDISVKFEELKKESSISEYVRAKLEETLDEIVCQIERELNEREYNKKYISAILELLSDYDLPNRSELPEEFIHYLSSAEYLYNQFIADNNESSDLDYSFVAILFYKALENLIDKTFYVPYLAQIPKDEIQSRFTEYFDKSSKGVFHSGKTMPENLELGSFHYILTYEKYPTEMVKFFDKTYVPGAQEKLRAIGRALKEISERRNRAAHGTYIVEYRDAIIAKSDTFSTDWKAEVKCCKGTIIDYLQILKH